MEIVRQASAGTFESSDAYITVEPAEKLVINIDSVVFNQYAQAINDAINQTLKELGVTKGQINVKDRGALDCVIQARVETAVLRASEGEAK